MITGNGDANSENSEQLSDIAVYVGEVIEQAFATPIDEERVAFLLKRPSEVAVPPQNGG